MELAGVGVAAVLMYTAPAWVILFSVVLFKERLGRLKVFAVVLAFAGCALIGQVYDLASVRLNGLGLLAGLGAGLTYGLYIIFCKVAQRRYSIWTTMAYALGPGMLFLLPFQSPAMLARAISTPRTLFWLLMLGLGPTLGGGAAFNAGLRHIPASDASVVATLEPVLAMLLGWAILCKRLESLQFLGAGLVLVTVIVLQRAR